MNLIREYTYKECVIVLLCIVMFGNFADGAVLCFGSDGHVSVELTSDCCDESMGIPVQGSLDSCGDCMDIPLSGNCAIKQLRSSVTKKSSPLKIQAKAIMPVSTNKNVSTSKERIAGFGNYVSDALTSIGTTVLII